MTTTYKFKISDGSDLTLVDEWGPLNSWSTNANVIVKSGQVFDQGSDLICSSAPLSNPVNIFELKGASWDSEAGDTGEVVIQTSRTERWELQSVD